MGTNWGLEQMGTNWGLEQIGTNLQCVVLH